MYVNLLKYMENSCLLAYCLGLGVGLLLQPFATWWLHSSESGTSSGDPELLFGRFLPSSVGIFVLLVVSFITLREGNRGADAAGLCSFLHFTKEISLKL